MKLWRILTLTIVLVSVGAPLVAGFTIWLPATVRTAVVVLAPPMGAAVLLVVYFTWRARLKSHTLTDSRPHDELAAAASRTQAVV
jgi:hypothetical protein